MSHQKAPKRLQDRLEDPGNLRSIGEIWDAVKDFSTPLVIRLRTDDTVFVDVPVRIWWIHGLHKWQSKNQPEQHKLVFDIPDEVWRQVQSRYARHFHRKLFGNSYDETLSQPIRSALDDSRPEWDEPDDGFVIEELTDDWFTLRKAIEQCAAVQPGLPICFEGNVTGNALIAENRLEITIVSMLDQIIDNWRSEFRRMIGTRVTSGVY